MKKILGLTIAIVLVIGLVAGGTWAYFSDVESTTDNVLQAGTIDLAVNDENPWATAAFTFEDIKPCEELQEFALKLHNVGNNPGILYTSMSVFENDKDVDIDTTFEFYAGPSAGPGTPETRPEWEMTADQFARLVYVAAVTYQYKWPDDPEGPYVGSVHDDLPNWLAMDANGDGYVSLWEVADASPIPYDPVDDPLEATAEITYFITFHLAHAFEESAGVAYTGGMDAYTGDYSLYMGTAVVWNVPQADGIDVTVTANLYQVGYGP